jgi:hypothetical protein
LKFSEQVKNGVKFQLDVSYQPNLIKQNIERGYPVFPFDVLNYFKIDDINLHLKNRPIKNPFIKKYGFKLSLFLNKISNFLNLFDKIDKNIVNYDDLKIQEITYFPEEINSFWDKTKNQYKFVIENKKDYLNWRYCEKNGGKFVAYIATLENEILGYIILRINRHDANYPTGHIVNLFTLHNRIEAAEYLISNAVKYFKINDINTITYFGIKGNQYDKYLKKYNFLPSTTLFKLFFKAYTDMQKYINIIKNSSKNQIHLVSGNFDQI